MSRLVQIRLVQTGLHSLLPSSASTARIPLPPSQPTARNPLSPHPQAGLDGQTSHIRSNFRGGVVKKASEDGSVREPTAKSLY